ncbi:MAG: hypothetical protein A2033_04430 [Bacteroidetes bacterium GWA2_31_9]|nr:MAG: hypothetical protein A2033_04430 [Bacteroidetes bacterium GWA2_31_9]
MNKDTFYNYIESPEILDQTSLKDLSELLVDYPYFQAAQMLYSKNLHNINHVKYDAQLKLTSAYIYNRKRLFQLINLKPKVNVESNIDYKSNEVVTENSINEEVLIDKNSEIIDFDENILIVENIVLNDKTKEFENEAVDINENVVEDDIHEKIVSEHISTNEESKINTENVQQIDEDFKIADENLVVESLVINEIIENKEEKQSALAENIELKTETTTQNSSNIADEILNRVANLKHGLDDNKQEKTESIADIILRKSALAKNKKELENKELELKNEEIISKYESLAIDGKNEIVITETLDIEKIIENKPEEIDQYRNIADNLIVEAEIEQSINNNVPEIQKQEIITESIVDELIDNAEIISEEKIEEVETEVIFAETNIKNENLAFNDWFNVLKGSPVKSQEVKKVENSIKLPESELIEKFIKDEPRITPIKNSNIDFNVDISKSVVSESDSFITETLAKIYIKQGYYYKALNIYQKLSLKYSENNTYFAKKIEEVKNLINK